jgi:hypothetical protein
MSMSAYMACKAAPEVPKALSRQGHARGGRVRPLNQQMNKRSLLARLAYGAYPAWAALLAVAVLAAYQAGGVEIWNGPPINFTNVIGSAPTLPASQDRLTLNVWLTRGFTHGLYNAAVETGYTSLSPVGTEWAYGTLPNYASLNYQTWVIWNGKYPPSMVGQDAVLHLIPDDVFLAIRFTFWNVGAGGFSYTRSTPPVPEPSAALLLLLGTAAMAAFGVMAGKLRASPASPTDHR